MYSREIDGGEVTLAPSGWTYGENTGRSVFVLFDKETESTWYPIDQPCCTLPTEEIGSTGLVGIGGAHADRVLKRVKTMSIMTWSDWKARFPDSGPLTTPSSSRRRAAGSPGWSRWGP